MRKRKSWREKLADTKGLPRVEAIQPRQQARWGTGSFVIPSPIEVDALMKKVPKGKVTTLNEIRTALALRHQATICCPITCGIFAWIAAHAAAEEAAAGRKKVTPYWRTLKVKGQLNARYPGGVVAIRKQLRAEGHQVTKRGNNYYLPDYTNFLFVPKP